MVREMKGEEEEKEDGSHDVVQAESRLGVKHCGVSEMNIYIWPQCRHSEASHGGVRQQGEVIILSLLQFTR